MEFDRGCVHVQKIALKWEPRESGGAHLVLFLKICFSTRSLFISAGYLCSQLGEAMSHLDMKQKHTLEPGYLQLGVKPAGAEAGCCISWFLNPSQAYTWHRYVPDKHDPKRTASARGLKQDIRFAGKPEVKIWVRTCRGLGDSLTGLSEFQYHFLF